MARVKLRKVLSRVDAEARFAMHDALRLLAPDADINADRLTREFLRRLEARASTYVRVNDSDVQMS